MFKGETCTGARMIEVATSKPPFGAGLTMETAKKADRLEVWHTSFSDVAPDYSEFRLFKGKKVIAKKKVGGY